MNVGHPTDQASASPEPRDIRTYLRSAGWARPVDRSSKPDIWQIAHGKDIYETIAPGFRSNPDYTSRVEDLLRTLSVVEGRPAESVLRDLMSVAYDIQYFRTFHETPSGTAPIRSVVETYSALDMLVASVAASMTSKSAVLSPSALRRGHNQQGKVLAGPTSAGSYVVSIWVPIPPVLTPEEDYVLFEIDDKPPERLITEHLRSALDGVVAAAAEAAAGRDMLEAFATRADEGITANLCEAIVGIAGNEGRSLVVDFAWALGRPRPASSDAVTIHGTSIDLISKAAEALRQSIPEPEVQLIGNVVRLHRDNSVGPGEVTIAGSVMQASTQVRRRVSVPLSEFDYEQAIRAHRSGVDVSVVGNLSRRGNRFRLTGVDAMTVFEE